VRIESDENGTGGILFWFWNTIALLLFIGTFHIIPYLLAENIKYFLILWNGTHFLQQQMAWFSFGVLFI
jgi:hypothetical protein